MNYQIIRYIAQKFSNSAKRQRFLNFSRLVAFISVMLGTIALIISLSVLTGFDKALHENAVKFTSHIQIVSFNRQPLANYQETIRLIKGSFPEVEKISPVIEKEGLIKSKGFVDGVMLKGINNGSDLTSISKNIVSGKFNFTSEYSKEIIIGKRLSDKLKVKIGDSVVVYAMRQTPEGKYTYPDISRYRVTALYETGMSKYDDMIIYIPFGTAQMIAGMDASSTISYEVMLKDISSIKEVSSRIQDFLGYPHYSITVYDIHSAMFSWIELQKEPIPIVLGLISIVAVFNILTILLITVVEKTHSIAVLRTLGLKNKEIMGVFIFQGTSIGFMGTLVGSALALILCFLQQKFKIISLSGDIYFMDALPVEISVWHYLIVIGTAVVLSLVSTLIPSFIATRINAIRALRFK
jgi:lipoprotein-releasing system permease protein